jgi:hypothetical protein
MDATTALAAQALFHGPSAIRVRVIRDHGFHPDSAREIL